MGRLASFAAGVVCALTGGAAVADEVTTYQLDNGMDVVVIEDHRAPVVVQMVWYKVGAADEQAGTSGVAHFLEHLLFRGTEKFPDGEFSALIEGNGGSSNAFTSYDYTAYFQRVAADRLELVMQLESDRMTGLLLDEEIVATERNVILEERNQRTENDPGALFAEQRSAALYLNHPYGVPVIGWKHEMEQLSLDDAQTFYETYYAPNNAILVVAGDVDPEEVYELAKTYYGPLEPSANLPERVRPQEPPQRAERRLTYTDPRVAQPYVIRSYLAPERDPGDQDTAAALTMLAALLGGDAATSFLGERLQFDSQRSVYTSAFYDGFSIDDGTFGLINVPVPGVSLDEAEADLDAAVAAFIEAGVDMEKFERLKTQIRASEIYAKDSTQGLARRYGQALAMGFSVEDVQSWTETLMAVTPEDVMAAADMIFDRNKAVTGFLSRPEPPASETPAEVTQ